TEDKQEDRTSFYAVHVYRRPADKNPGAFYATCQDEATFWKQIRAVWTRTHEFSSAVGQSRPPRTRGQRVIYEELKSMRPFRFREGTPNEYSRPDRRILFWIP